LNKILLSRITKNENNWTFFILFLLGALIYSMVEKCKNAKGYYDKTLGFQITFPNKTWSILISGGLKRVAWEKVAHCLQQGFVISSEQSVRGLAAYL